MDLLKKNNKEKYTKQFGKWDATLTKAKVNSLEALYKKAHAEIRKAPKRAQPAKKTPVRKQVSKANGSLIETDSKGRKWLRQFKLTNEQRKARVAAKIQKALAKK